MSDSEIMALEQKCRELRAEIAQLQDRVSRLERLLVRRESLHKGDPK